MAEQKPTCNVLEQFILLAKGAKGTALMVLIKQVLEAPGVYVFGELLELPNVQELAEGPDAAYFQLLNLFAYGTYPDYVASRDNLPELTAAQKKKLKHLTIVSLAARMKKKKENNPSSFMPAPNSHPPHPYLPPVVGSSDLLWTGNTSALFKDQPGTEEMTCIPYSLLLQDLDVKNLRELEDLIIEAIYTDMIQGTLDQCNQLLEVDLCVGRDLRKKDIHGIIKTLQEWCDGCESVVSGIEQQVLRANQYKENHIRTQQQVEVEVTSIRKTLKATASTSSQELDQHLGDRDTPTLAEQRQPAKKTSKAKGLVSNRH